MKNFTKRSLIVTATAAAALSLAAPLMASPTVGVSAPDFTAVDSNGVSHNLSDFSGKTVVLEWTNDGCPYVKKHYESGNMQAIQKSAVADDVVWLSVISSAPGKQGHVDGAGANAIVAKHDAAPSAVLLDESGDLGRLYGARTTPHMYVINGGGDLVYQGAIDSNRSANPATIAGATNYVTAALDAVKAGGLPANAQTQPYGCSVKY